MVRKVATGTDDRGAGLAFGEDVLDASGVVTTGASDLSLLRQGKITEAEYIDRLVESATRHLEGAVTGERLEAIRSVVRAQFSALGAADELAADEPLQPQATASELGRATEPRLGALLRRVTA